MLSMSMSLRGIEWSGTRQVWILLRVYISSKGIAWIHNCCGLRPITGSRLPHDSFPGSESEDL